MSQGLSSKEVIIFSGIDKHQHVNESIHKKLFQIKQYISVEDPLSIYAQNWIK